VSKRAEIALVAAVALASLTVASVRIAHAVHGSSTRELQTPVYGSPRAEQAATFGSLLVPPGFHRFHPCAGGACFIRREPVALEVAEVRRLAESFGVRLPRSTSRPPTECGIIVHRVCRVEGTIGAETVWVWVRPPEVRTHERPTRRNRRSIPASVVIQGSEVEVTVIGHCLHPRECAELQHEQASERPSLTDFR
jgi:hypothetical protein